MEQMTITAKVQIVATDADKVSIDETMSVYRDACNYVSDYVFRTHDLKQFSLNKVLYSTLREKFGLKSQMAQSVLKTVIARYRTILENQNKWIRPTFKKPQYDLEQKLIYKAKQNQSSVINVDPRYTSQCCPVCGHTEKSNRNKKIHLFTCKNCGYQSNDDRIGAMNLYRMEINYLSDPPIIPNVGTNATFMICGIA